MPLAVQSSSVLPEAVCPPGRSDIIHNIIETVDRYNPENLGLLEDYVREQMGNDSIDTAANLAVLKLYQFNPDLTNITIVTFVLALALANLPEPDFNLALCLLSEDVLDDHRIAHLVKLQTMLEGCQFKQFWKLLDAESTDEEGMSEDKEAAEAALATTRSILDEYPEFDTRIRKFISATLSAAYQTIPVSLLEDNLNLTGEDLADYLKSIHCTAYPEDSTLVDFPGNRDALLLSRPAVVQESIKFEQLTKIIGAARLT